ncbi:hypothetical protein Y5S_03437 [Alcanivorax nanhaiticus]|uniref:Uncharacterized protein n=2 Tax=Alcanivorax nanhaiticus TaxID=1177154 RepID=A0A095SFE4_9GAMM|nr:hypothetical protein Y5S_03437 [Alcanivorax nanhaiticus]
MDDENLAQVTGQNGSLFLSDHIGANELAGQQGVGSPTDFDFYRMGMDVKLNLNMNIAKFQLGCGGVNDLLTTSPACDIDIDYLSFMGINNDGDFPSLDGPDSAFELIRPYVELAIKNDDAATLREVVGFKVGGQRINGALTMGRDYTGAGKASEGYTGPGVESLAPLINQEHGGICNPGATTGQGVVNCHSGINSVSGFLSLELSAAIRARANIAGFITTDLNTCFGRMNPTQYGCHSGTTPFLVDAGGTRMQQLHVAAAKLSIDAIDLNCQWWNILVCGPAQLVADSLITEGYGQLVIDMRQVHYLLTPDTENFFISVQREPVAWPNYSKALPLSNVAYDACNPSYGQIPSNGRCGSAYAPTANTGWWLNAPGAKLLNINPPDRINVGNVDIGTVVSLLGPEGRLIIDNPKIDLPRVSNCYGSAVFC